MHVMWTWLSTVTCLVLSIIAALICRPKRNAPTVQNEPDATLKACSKGTGSTLQQWPILLAWLIAYALVGVGRWMRRLRPLSLVLEREHAEQRRALPKGVERYGWGLGVVATLGGRIG